MQSVSTRIWTRVAVSISYDDNHYTTGTSFFLLFNPKSGVHTGVHTFPKGICPKVNVIARREYELAYYDSAVHHFNHYTTRLYTKKKEKRTRQYFAETITGTDQSMQCTCCWNVFCRLKFLHRVLSRLISFYVGMILFRIELSTHSCIDIFIVYS